MAVFDQLTIPDEGVALLTSVIANQGTLTVTEMRFSDIDYTGQEHSITAATWAGTFQTVTPSASVHDTTTINVTGSFTNAGYSTDKTLKTVGIVGEDSNGVPTLIGVAVATSYDVIPQQYITPSTFTYSANIVVSSTADIHVSGSQAGALFVTDIIDDLTSQDTDKPLSANQGYVLKGLIDNVQGGGSNPNLMDNAWFAVNQRGVTSGTVGTTDTNLMDRWKCARIDYSLSSSGFAFSWDGVNSTDGFMRQITEADTSLLGKEMTFSVIVDGDLKTETFTLSNQDQTFALILNELSVTVNGNNANGNRVVTLRSYTQTTHTIKAVKLEEGSESTLHLDHYPTNREQTVELLNCQRYFKRFKANENNARFVFGMFHQTTEFRVVIPLSTPMRATPTATYSGTITIARNASKTNVNASAIAGCIQRVDGCVELDFTTATAVAGEMAFLSLATSGDYIDLSAEL